ncbi:hypothetical protein GCM10007103_29260 [Salinimicrobium marinum]|uniref:Uncharacterized protein n=2 Tax=Salinimicrobium marinum TaxID=680283 RepID=A0A918SJE1_9FLAO|nr:hypothetical protein GCM10007103_29260 [Salinimicrobium marinum]
MHINHMQKALTTMNIRLKEVISQIHGASGLKLIRAILAGERDPKVLVEMCDSRILKTKKDLVIKSLKGHYNEAGLFALEQAVTCYDFYQVQIARWDEQLEEVLKKISSDKPIQDYNKKPR